MPIHQPLIGNQEDWARYQNHLHRLMDRPGRSFLLIMGEEGSGKSYFLQHCQAEAQRAGWEVLEGYCDDQVQSNPYQPLFNALGLCFDKNGAIINDHSITSVVDQIALDDVISAVTDIPGIGAVVAFGLIGKAIYDARKRPEQGKALLNHNFEFIHRVLDKVYRKQKRPLLLAIEDLHYAGATTFDLLDYLLTTPSEVRLLILATWRYRPMERKEHAHRVTDHLPAELRDTLRKVGGDVLLMTPLTQEESHRFIQTLIPGFDAPALSARLHDLTHGYPGILRDAVTLLLAEANVDPAQLAADEELVGNLWARLQAQIDGQAPTQDGGRIGVSIATVVASTLARRYIAPLSAEARAVLQCAAVLGRAFPVSALTATPLREYLGLSERAILGILFDHAVDGRLLTTVDVQTLSFVSSSLRDYLVQHIPPPILARDHLRVAQALAEVGATPGEIAQHFYAGGNYASALVYARQAGETLVRDAAFPEATVAYRLALAALERLPATPEYCMTQIDLLIAASFALEQTGEWDSAIEQLNQALALSQDDPTRQAEVKSHLGWLYFRKGELHQARELLEESAAACERLGDEAGRLQNDYYLGVVYAGQKEWSRAIAHFERHIATAEARGQQAGLAWAYLELGSVYRQQRQWDRAGEYLHRGLDLARQSGDYSAQAQAYHYLGMIYGRQARPEAIDYLQQALEIVQNRTKQPHLEAMIQNTLAETLVRFNRLSEAAGAFEASAAIKERLGDQAGLAMTYGGLARLYHRQWKLALAATYYQRDLEVLSRDPAANVAWIQQITNSLGEVYRLSGDGEAAAACFQRTLALAEEIPDETERRRSRGYSHLSLARLALDQGELDQARQYLELAHAGLADTWMAPEVEREWGVLERLSGNLAAARQHLERARAGFEQGEDYEKMLIAYDLALLCQAEGRPTDAEVWFHQAQSLAEALGNETMQRQASNVNTLNVKRQTSKRQEEGDGEL